jgi:hypothetical protein
MRTVFLAVLCAALGGATSPDALPAINIAAFCTDPSSTNHTACIKKWVHAGRIHPFSKLYAAAGTYYYADSATLYSGINIECEDQNQTTFKNIGGNGTLFEAEAPVTNVRISRCGFDVNGNTAEYLAVISISPSGSVPSRNVRLSRIRVRDSMIPGQMSAVQRYYLLVTDCIDCSAENNHLSEGGRIKMGRPGSQLVIRNNTIEHANDNAITVVDIGLGTSDDILIEGNHIIDPKVTGIFFGGDGQVATGGSVTRRVHIYNNDITGDWGLACIQGTLPSAASEIHIRGNTCTKTGTGKPYQAGISLNRTDGAIQRVDKIRIESNHVLSPGCVAAGGIAPLDYGGIFIAGNYDRVDVFQNEIDNVGPRALYLHDVDILHGRITHNTMVGGNLVVQGSVGASTSPNTITPSCG